jgi:hypothetical protein
VLMDISVAFGNNGIDGASKMRVKVKVKMARPPQKRRPKFKKYGRKEGKCCRRVSSCSLDY